MIENYWGTDYWHAMDRSHGKEDIINISPSQMAISHGIGDPLQGLKSNIFVGASQVELGFMGQGKGFRSQPTGWTPESVSTLEREAIRQLAKINEVQLSTHATPNVAISGITQQGFSEERREEALFEVKKAIDFAADAAGGGPVVLHAQEFPRSIVEKYGKPEEQYRFEQYPTEKEKAILPLVDEKTGQLINLRRDIPISEPIIDEKTGDPVRDEEGKIKVVTRDFDYYENKFDKLSVEEKKHYSNDVGKYFYAQYAKRSIEQAEGQAEYYDEKVRELEKVRNSYANIKKEVIDKAKNKDYAASLIAEKLGGFEKFTPEEIGVLTKDPSEFMEKRIKDINRSIQGWREGVISARRQSHQLQEEVERIKPIEDYGVKKSAEAIGRAATYAYDKEQERNLERPLVIVPENWTPEVYGSHPEELKQLVQESRKAMVNQLVKEKHIDKEKANRIAEDRIKATFDIGHLNMWRKYFKGSDKEFKQWVDQQVQGLLKDKIIGHVHITDNFGYHDEHLTPGEGTAPVREFLQKLEEKGYKGTIVAEPGGQPEGQLFRSLTGLWGQSNYGMYRVDGMQRSWSDIENSYFGYSGAPRFVVGDFAPSKDWSLWSEIPLE